jgi:GNAT superfamily N-acetyltransferase
MEEIAYLKLTDQNLAEEHICCAFSDKKCTEGYEAKKQWLRTEFASGYTFRKLDARGKIFIEYVPIEASWLPLSGSHFMVINCFWVSGRFKGKGHGKELLRQCLEDAKDMDGVVAITGDKKRPFMSDPKFFKRQGFEIIDRADPYFVLWGKPSPGRPKVPWPQFLDTARSGACPEKEGIVSYYSNTCPFTEYWNHQMLQAYADKKGVPLTIHKITSREEGRKMPIPWIIHSVFYEGKLVTLELKPDRHLEKIIP